jgi:antagonist of KipI
MAPDVAHSIVPLGEAALLIELGSVSRETTRRARLLADVIRDSRTPGVYDVVPAYRTVLVRFDPLITDGERVGPQVAAVAGSLDQRRECAPRVIELPVAYGGEDGPDLEDVAKHTGLSAAEVVRRHAGADYTVEFLGFSPGFPYLSGLDEALATPRLPAPRTKVPAGSVGIAGLQTGFYPMSSPGGWRLIGRLSDLDFDPTQPESLPYKPGDIIRFVPISQRDGTSPRAGSAGPARAAWPEHARGYDPAIGERGLRISSAGTLSTVQDLGRFGYASLGYACAGALDREALLLANRLVGNDYRDAVIEITNHAEFEAIGDLLVAVTGADLAPAIDGEPIDICRAASLRHGMRLTLGPPRRGVRAYLAVDGGIRTPPLLGSRSTDVVAGLGGWHGRALRVGDVLPLAPRDRMSYRQDRRVDGRGFMVDARTATKHYRDIEARVTWGPQTAWFDAAARSTFLATTYEVSPRSDRMGLRLTGPSLVGTGGGDLASEGSVPGVIQVPPDGHPIILLADSRGVGGYPKIATVVDADLALLGQAEPGRGIRFVLVDVQAALQATREAASRRGQITIAAVPELAVRCLIEDMNDSGEHWLCPRSRSCLISRRCCSLDRTHEVESAP